MLKNCFRKFYSISSVFLFLMASKPAEAENIFNASFYQISFGTNSLASIISKHYDPFVNSDNIEKNEPKISGSGLERFKINKKNNEFSLTFGLDPIHENFLFGGSVSINRGELSVFYPNGTNLVPFATSVASSSLSFTTKLFKDYELNDCWRLTVGLGYSYASTRQELRFGNVLIYDNLNLSKNFMFGKLEFIPPMFSNVRVFVEHSNLGGATAFAGVGYSLKL